MLCMAEVSTKGFFSASPFLRVSASRLAEGIKTFGERSFAAGKHRCVAQSVGAGFRFAQFLNQIKEVRRIIGLKSNHKFLIIETKGIGSVKFDRAILGSYPDVFV